MDTLLNNIYAQAGALGLLTISGWVMWYLERKERLSLQQKKDMMLEELIRFMSEQKDIIEKISEGLQIQELLRTEFIKISNHPQN